MHTGLIMHMHGYSCVRMILPRNPNPNFDDFAFGYTCNASILDLSLCIHAFELLFHIFDCLFAFHMLELGFILCFPYFNAMNTDSHVHV